jgi:hypothetical protein
VHRVAQVRNANALDHLGVTENGGRAGKVVEEADSGAEKNRRNVDVKLVEQAGFQQPPHVACAAGHGCGRIVFVG